MKLHETPGGNHIRVCAVSPALVRSRFSATMLGSEREDLLREVSDKPQLESEDVAATIRFILAAPKHVQVHDIVLRHKDAIY